ncbi:ubiquitin-specific protease ubp15 [Ordospora colligata]|uniref:Ubiquitin carboxyl-terminal hydrolase n=1 Tax=Ordospora colligata OC4 TaxID=1354746 RepID=A0A0B2UL25_9MICR|nr:ubiquitin carboxyl-terminal hydrolase [Ordospora colligata OC4]KHN69717.1 ubiquitin carboxyl-terminal hydrolase [Ordospora colligata OC4]
MDTTSNGSKIESKQFSKAGTGVYVEDSDEDNIRVDVVSGEYDSKESTGYVGLKNHLGTTCYMNSVMQTLFGIRKFRNYVYAQEPKGIMLSLQRLFKAMQENRKMVDTTDFVVNNAWFDNMHVQQDVHEFSKILFNSLQKDSGNKEFIEKLIQGEQITYIKADCGCFRRKEEKFQDIQVEIKDFMNNKLDLSLIESLKRYVKTERLEGSNQYSCEKHGLVNAEKGVMFGELPPVIFVLLKRFYFNLNTETRYKLNDYFEYPDVLDMKQFVDEQRIDGLEESKNENRANMNEYELYSVIVHRGDVEEGHFYAYLKHGGEWLKFNDGVVTKSRKEEVMEGNFGGKHPYKDIMREYSGYYLVYIRKSMIEEILNDNVTIKVSKEKHEEVAKIIAKVNGQMKNIIPIVAAVLLIVAEAVITGMSIMNALKNGNEIFDRVVINKMIMATSIVLMIISVVMYLMNEKRTTIWYDAVMIGCSALLAIMRICTIAMSNYVNIISIIIIAMSVAMLIGSVLAFIGSKNKNTENKKIDKNNENGKAIMAKNASVIFFTFCVAITGWSTQIMNMVKNSEINNEILQE